MRVKAAFATLLTLAGALGMAGSTEAFQLPQVNDAATLKECAACHMIYPPQMLPARSWTALLGDLGNHFNEDATLDAKTQAGIAAYLTANAADAPQNIATRLQRVLRGLNDTDVPLRITELPWWKRAHGEVSAAAFAKPSVKSASNCIACHKGSDQGLFVEPGE